MQVLNVTGGISRNAAEQTARRLRHYFTDCSVTCGIFESGNPEFEQIAAEKGMQTKFYGPSVTDRFEEVSLLPGEGYLNAAVHAVRDHSKYDLVHVYGGPLVHGPIGKVHAIINRCPLITRFNGYVPLPDEQPKRTIVDGIVTRLLDSSRVVFNSHAQKDDVLSTYGVTDGEHINVIPPGVEQQYYDPDESCEHLADAIGIDPSTKVIGSVITPRPVKRLDRAFEILASVAEDTDVLYVVVGDSEGRAEYQHMAEEMGVGDRVHWAGYQEQAKLAEWYSLFDVTILTSEWESFGMSITESYLCETPCVAFDVGGMSDQIVDDSTGYLVEPYDLEAFADAIKAILSDPEQAAAFGEAGREYVQKRFTLDSVADQYGEMIAALQ